MKKNLKNKLLILLLLLPLLVGACKNESHTNNSDLVEYTCPMHPQVVKDGPGTCPICKMDLVPKKVQADTTSSLAVDEEYLLKPVNALVIANIETVKAETGVKTVETEIPGVITYDTRKTYSIPARFGGRIEKLYIRYNFQAVKKGEKLMEVYSPDLITAQQEFIYLLKTDPENTGLIQRARQKLNLLGLTENQINRLKKTKKPIYSIAIFSNYSGYITEASTENSASSSTTPSTSMGGGMDGMGGSTPAQTSTSPLFSGPGQEISLREGMYITTGQTLFKIVNTDKLWAEFEMAGRHASHITEGMSLVIVAEQTNVQQKAEVDLIQPFINEGENFVKIRSYVKSTDSDFLVGQLVRATLTEQSDSTTWLPSKAVWDLGTRSIVFQKEANNVFKPIEVTTGKKAGNQVEIISKLPDQALFASNAHYMVDSESFIKINNTASK